MSVDLLALRQVPLFATLPLAEIEELARGLKAVEFEAGTILFREGEVGDRFYVVLAGEIAFIKAMDTLDERLVGVRGPGEFVGEMSLLNQDGLRTASVRVYQDARVLELSRADFDALLHRHPTLAYTMLQVLSSRLRLSNDTAIRDLHEKNRRLEQAYAELQAAQARLIEQETLARELQLAREIQESMLPHRLPEVPGFELCGRMLPARMIGGDFYDVIPLGADRLGLVVGDVSGKGVPAALFMALTCSLLRAEATRSASPEEALRAVNHHLVAHNMHSMFVTVLFGILHCGTHRFEFARAGHDLPLILDAHGTPRELTLGRGHPLGLFANPALDIQSIVLPPGGAMLLFTDGASEALSAGNELFGIERIATALGAGLDRPAAELDRSAAELCDQLLASFAAFRGHAPQSDDITLLLLRAREHSLQNAVGRRQ
jgi:sigma-B regulation protein RsbU (phosphoserine phosphatase)